MLAQLTISVKNCKKVINTMYHKTNCSYQRDIGQYSLFGFWFRYFWYYWVSLIWKLWHLNMVEQCFMPMGWTVLRLDLLGYVGAYYSAHGIRFRYFRYWVSLIWKLWDSAHIEVLSCYCKYKKWFSKDQHSTW